MFLWRHFVDHTVNTLPEPFKLFLGLVPLRFQLKSRRNCFEYNVERRVTEVGLPASSYVLQGLGALSARRDHLADVAQPREDHHRRSAAVARRQGEHGGWQRV